MRLYLKHTASGQFSDAADYPNGQPYPAPTGFEWAEGDPPSDAVMYIEKTVDKELEEILFSAMVQDSANITATHMESVINQKVIITEALQVIKAIEGMPIPQSAKDKLILETKTACKALIDKAAAPATATATEAKANMKARLG